MIHDTDNDDNYGKVSDNQDDDDDNDEDDDGDDDDEHGTLYEASVAPRDRRDPSSGCLATTHYWHNHSHWDDHNKNIG